MIITKLILHNFGVYEGTNEFKFQNQKPVVLIGGMNGRGKTTFLEAVLLSLYGANSFAYSESKYHTYGQYLKSYVNISDKSLNTYVELEFKMESNSNDYYSIHREWSGVGQRTREKINVKKNNITDSFLTDNWSMFIEGFLPSGLSNFFFFDGEKISELAVENTNSQMKESIKALLGINVLDHLESDINRIISKVTKSFTDQIDISELERLKSQKTQADADLQFVDDEILETQQEIIENTKEIEKAKGEYSAKGGELVAQRQELFNQRIVLKTQIEQSKDELISLASSELPFYLIIDLLEEIDRNAAKEHEQSINKAALSKINAMFNTFVSKYNTEHDSTLKFIEFMKEQTEEESVEMIYDLSSQSIYQVNNLLSRKLKDLQLRLEKLLANRERLQKKAEEIDNYLSVDFDEKALAKIYKRIKVLEQTEIKLSAHFEALKRKRVSLNGESIRATSAYNRHAESLLSKLESNDDAERIITYSKEAIKVLKKYKIRLQENKVDSLAKTMTQCYKQIANKKNLINKIKIDSITLDLKYLNRENEIVSKESLSAGEKQLMVISLLWALAICSKRKLPVIIDTPLSRLDSVHRLSLITSYFPNVSDQTIILSTDSEITQFYYDAMKESIGDEFTLIYDDEHKCSKIKPGYLMGENS